MVDYQWEKYIKEKVPKKELSKWFSKFGPVVTKREKGLAKTVKFQLLIDNSDIDVFLVGSFNDWGDKNLNNYKLKKDEHSVFGEIEINNINHKDPYKFLVIQNQKREFRQDPAGVYFDEHGNTIFWDFEDPTSAQPKESFVNTIERPTIILQTDLPGLIVHWANKDGICARDIDEKEYYKFITNSGIIEHIKKLGYNTIQFLPFAQSIDGLNWKFRYLVPFQFAIQKNWGDPNDFIAMVDEFHKNEIAIIGDFVIGHLPFKDYNIFGKNGEESGIQNWVKKNYIKVYMKEETRWGTMRTDFDSEYVRAFIISSCLHFLKYYKIDGLRIDNVDGIIRYGDNGDGPERENGRKFLRELNSTIYDYNPYALMHFEAHYYYQDNAKMLVAPIESEDRALGATAYNSSRMTYYFHTEYMLKDVKQVTPWRFREIASEKEWGKSNSTIADFHNHDAAAGLIEMRATGSYAYDTMTGKNPNNHIHAVGKIKVMEAIISFCAEGRTLDLAQTFLLQMGTFEHDSSIRWQLAFTQVNNNMTEYKKEVNKIMCDPAFWPINVNNRKFLNVDDKNKIIVIEKSAKNKFVIVINISSNTVYHYKVGLESKKDFEPIFNSDLFEYAGTGTTSYPKSFKNQPSKNFELLDREIQIDKIAPYGVIVLKETS